MDYISSHSIEEELTQQTWWMLDSLPKNILRRWLTRILTTSSKTAALKSISMLTVKMPSANEKMTRFPTPMETSWGKGLIPWLIYLSLAFMPNTRRGVSVSFSIEPVRHDSSISAYIVLAGWHQSLCLGAAKHICSSVISGWEILVASHTYGKKTALLLLSRLIVPLHAPPSHIKSIYYSIK